MWGLGCKKLTQFTIPQNLYMVTFEVPLENRDWVPTEQDQILMLTENGVLSQGHQSTILPTFTAQPKPA